MLLPTVKLKTKRASRHPWIYKKMTHAPRGVRLDIGSLVSVKDVDGKTLGQAFYHPDNTIALRMITENPGEDVDAEFILNRLSYAKTFREDVLGLPRFGDSYRLANAEADGLPGLVIDKFADVILVEPYIAGWMHLVDILVDCLKKLYPRERIAIRADAGAAVKEGVSFAKLEKNYPAPASVDMEENGVKYRVDFATGHKTGFFLDQRDNRRFVGEISKGRHVLDLCSYTGGFALSAWKGGAKSILAIDLDEKAIAAAKVNAQLNGAEKAITFVHQDAFETLRGWDKKKERPDFIILDPPKLAGGQDDVEKALKAYKDFNEAAIRLAAPGALFVTCSCSGAVPEERWKRTVRQAAATVGRGLTVFRQSGPGGDHPVLSDFPQGQYLKVLFSRVE